MRRISFGLTTAQIEARTKFVTRRLGWRSLVPGTRLQAVDRVMGFRPGVPPARLLAVIEVVSVRTERIDAITEEEVRREGFPDLTTEQFVSFFCEEMGCGPETEVQRIEFCYVDELAPGSPVPRVDRMTIVCGTGAKPRRKIGDRRVKNGREQVCRQARSGGAGLRNNGRPVLEWVDVEDGG